jgi:hypothetical protein
MMMMMDWNESSKNYRKEEKKSTRCGETIFMRERL